MTSLSAFMMTYLFEQDEKGPKSPLWQKILHGIAMGSALTFSFFNVADSLSQPRMIIAYTYATMQSAVAVLHYLNDWERSGKPLHGVVAMTIVGGSFAVGAQTALHLSSLPKAGPKESTLKEVTDHHYELPYRSYTVPLFSGELREWQEHRELSDIEKFTYLRTYITGLAKFAIEGVRLEEANYAVGVKVLQKRCGHHTAPADKLINSLLAIPTVDRLFEEVRLRTGCLDSLGAQASEYAVTLHPVLMRSLSEHIAEGDGGPTMGFSAITARRGA
ncbi:hypothetical protein MTO96_035088 [Rhipicephalus appendiculatus]